MTEPIPVNEKVKVVTIYDPIRKLNRPLYVHWKSRGHKIEQVGYHHKVRIGRTMWHVYHVNSDTISFRLLFNTDTLDWFLENVYVQD